MTNWLVKYEQREITLLRINYRSQTTCDNEKKDNYSNAICGHIFKLFVFTQDIVLAGRHFPCAYACRAFPTLID